MPRKSLSDILHGDARARLQTAWEQTEAAEDFTLLPRGDYVALLESAENFEAKTGTAGVKLTFRVLEGQHAGRKVWHDCWLTEAAMKQTKRDLGKIGIADFNQLDGPTPQGIDCQVRVVVHTADDTAEQTNRVRRIDVLRIEPPTLDPFAPANTNGDGNDQTNGEANEGDAQ